MTKAILTIFFLILGWTSLTQGQQNEDLVRIKCDTTIWSLTNYPPKLNKTNEELNRIINQGLQIGNQISDSIKFIYVCAVIKCDGSAEYKCFSKPKDTLYLKICGNIIDILKSNCKWTPGKLNKDSYENALVKKGNKSVYAKRKVIEYVHYNFCMKLELRKGVLTIKE
jgi:hypothetical protein